MNHNFNVEFATKYGILEAILIQNIEFWIEKNRANNLNFYDGNYWTFNSTKAFSELFPYASQKQIQNALKKLENLGFILVGNYNKTTFDRTLWYAISEKGKSIMQKCEMEISTLENRSGENRKPIPDINTDIYINPLYPLNEEQEDVTDEQIDKNNRELIKQIIDYLNQKGNTSFKSTNKKTSSLINARIKQGYTLEDFKDVIWYCYCEWVENPIKFKNGKMSDTYFRPSTLFSETNFENYLQEYRKSIEDE